MSIKFMDFVWDNSPYKGAMLLLHLAMADHAHDDGRFFASQERLSMKARCSKEYVRVSVQQMVDDGVIAIERRGTHKGRATEYRLNRIVIEPTNSVGESETVTESLPNFDDQLPNSDGSLPNSAWTHPSYTSVLSNPPVVADAEAPTTDEPESESKRAQRLTRAYTDVVPMSNFAAVMGIVKKAIRAHHDDQSITDALLRLADASRPVTTDTLRIELEGIGPYTRAAASKPSGTSMFMQSAQRFATDRVGVLEQ